MTETDNHVALLRLFDLARQSGPQLNKDEKEHVRKCEECQHIVESFARQFDKDWTPPCTKPVDAA
jgi:hypothetical protein